MGGSRLGTRNLMADTQRPDGSAEAVRKRDGWKFSPPPTPNSPVAIELTEICSGYSMKFGYFSIIIAPYDACLA
ncbi:hypothetical protein CAJAP_06245 [Camponotus japonicus]